VLVLIRHGQATANAEGRLLGRSDDALTDRGREQIAAVASDLGPVSRLTASPLRRAVDSAAGLRLGLPVEVDDRWIELDYGTFERRPVGDVPAELWSAWRGDPDFRPEGGESLSSVGRRVRSACEDLFAAPGRGARSAEGDVVVVSHVSPIKAAVAWALGQGDELIWRLHLSTASITRVAWSAGAPLLYSYNETCSPNAADVLAARDGVSSSATGGAGPSGDG
jgi:broad specificity phosphatase PhoE